MSALSPADMEVLEFERPSFRRLGIKEGMVQARWGYSLARHSQRLHQIIDRPEAEVYDPELVRRLRRLRDARHEQRKSREKGWAK